LNINLNRSECGLSFSTIIKNELCRFDNKKKCCNLAELSTIIKTSVVANKTDLEWNETALKILTENAAFARRVFLSIKKLYGVSPETVIRRNQKLKKHILYIIIVTNQCVIKKLVEASKLEIKLLDKLCRRSFLRGAFLATGSVSDPEKAYHLEINSHHREDAFEIRDIINGFGLHAKVVRRKSNYITYLKEAENIVDFLNIIGAHTALLELENIRILKDMRNNVNRIVNCETANLDKMVYASVRQVDNIKFIRDSVGLSYLSDSLREISELRLEYPEATLKELGEMLSPPLGKSGVNHRLHKLDEIANKLR